MFQWMKRTRSRIASTGICGLALLTCAALAGVALPSSSLADWREPVGGASPINADARNARDPVLANVGGAPHVAWAEDTTQPGLGNSNGINVARFAADGASWALLAPGSRITRRATASTTGPSLTDVEGIPWVTWAENSDPGPEVHVARLSGADWIPMDDSTHPINRDPAGRANVVPAPGGEMTFRPSIAASGSRPYVAFFEVDPGTGSVIFPGKAPVKIWVVRLGSDGMTWEAVGGGPANADPSSDAALPQLALVDGRPWVTYFQVAGGGAVVQARVARLSDSGTGWTQVGGPLAQGGFGTVDPPAIAAVNGVATVAVGAALDGADKRIHVFQPPASGSTEWRRVGNGPASPANAQPSSPTVTGIGTAPWVSWNQSQSRHVARLVDGDWQQAGSAIGGSGGAEGPIASINGFPWAAFTESDNSVPDGPGTPGGCCSQVRVTRLEPTFGAARAFPSADTAALLSGVDAYGLPYPISFEYGEEGASALTGTTPPEPADGAFTIGEARGLKPGTLYSFQPFATAGTPLPLVRGTRENFATPPSSAAAAPPATPAPQTTQTTVISQPARLVVAIVRATSRVRRGGHVRVRVLSTEPGTVQLTVRRGRRVVRTITRSMRVGTQSLVWGTRRRSPGLYRLTVSVRSTDGRTASDVASVRVLRRSARRPRTAAD